MPSRTDGTQWLGFAVLAAGVALLLVYADGQAGHTFRFVAEWLVELTR